MIMIIVMNELVSLPIRSSRNNFIISAPSICIGVCSLAAQSSLPDDDGNDDGNDDDGSDDFDSG